MKFAVRFLLSVAVIAIGSVLILPSLIDWNALKPQIEARLEKELGRDVTLGGSIKASLLPEPHLEVNEVAIANAPGGEAASLLQLKSLEARIAVAPLLSGRIVVKGLRLVEPVLTVERMADGAFNFSFADVSAPGARSLALYERVDNVQAGRAFRLDPQAVSLDKVEVVKGTLIYRDHMLDASEILTALDGVLSAKTLAGPYAGEAGFAWQGRRWGVTGEVARPGEDGQRPLTVKLTEPATNLKASLIGRLAAMPQDDARTPWLLSGALVLRAERPEGMFQGAPANPPRPLALEGALRLDSNLGEIRDIALRWGDFTASGAFQLELGQQDRTPRYSLSGSGRALDLDALLPAPVPSDRLQIWPLALLAPRDAAGPAAASPDRPRSLFATLKGNFNFQLAALTYRKAEVSALSIAAASDAEGLNITKASAVLPGKSEFTLSGRVTRAGTGLHYNGALGLASEHARELLGWAGFPVAGIAKERLGRLAFRGGVDLTPGAIDLLNFQAGLDGAQLRGFLGATLTGPEQRPTIQGQITATRLNLEPYRGLLGEDQDRPLLQIASDVIETVDGMVAFDVDSMVIDGDEAQGVWGKLELKSGQLAFERLNILNWRGARLEGTGTFIALAGRSTVHWLGQMTGEDMRPVLSPLRLAAAQGERPIGPYGLRIEILLQSGSGQIIADGAIAGGAQVIVTSDLSSIEAPFAGRIGEGGRVATTLAFESESGLELGSLLGLGKEVSSLNEPALLSARYQIDPNRSDLSFSAMVGPDVARLSWRREGAGQTGRLSLDLDAKANDLSQTLGMLGANPEIRTALSGPFGLHVSASGPLNAVSFSKIDYRLSSEALSGTGTADLSGAHPRAELALEAGSIDLGRYLSLFQDPLIINEQWRTTPLMLSGLAAIEGHVALKGEALAIFGTTFQDAALDAKFDDGTLSVSNFKAGWEGGAVTANATLRGGAQLPGFALSMKFADVDSARLAETLFGKPFARGPVSGAAMLKSQGASPLALASALSGDVRLKGREGVLEGFDLMAFETRRKALRKGEPAEPVLGALTGGHSVVHAADLAFAIDQGRAQCAAGILDFDQGRGVLTGEIDVPRRALALDLNLPATGLSATPHLAIGGTLDAPGTVLALKGVAQALDAEAAARPPETPPPPAVLDTPPAPPPSDGEHLRSLIESLPSKTQ